jgi:branched-subunit amino acid transport protein AzlD
MVQPTSAPPRVQAPPSGAASGIVAAGAVFALLAVVGAVMLWVHYGTAVFFEIIKSGIAACI